MALQRVPEVVKPAVLRWARQAAGLTSQQAAKKIGVKPERLLEWELSLPDVSARPTVAQLRKAAHVYRRPLALFFMPTTPAQPAPLHDFRRLPANSASSLSPELLLEMRRARRRRAISLDLLGELGRGVPEVALRAGLEDDPEAVATRARGWLDVTLEEQTEWVGAYEALNGWIAAFEAHGVLVFQTGDVALDEMRGFALNERRLPVIVLNAKDAPRGRVFTLVHELTHVLLSGGGVCDPLRVGAHARTPDERVEVFCNRVAGAVLVPSHALLDDPLVSMRRGPREWDDHAFQQLSGRFAVSQDVVLRRLLILGLTSEAFYERKRHEYLAQYRALDARAREREGFAPLFRVALRDNGRAYTRLVLDALEQERITPADVTEYLGVRLKHLDDITGALERGPARG
jgi:Zn-dependent peptidase ImmA (M78 family)/transcriptional regulator with XRE-family HTH domain